MARVASSEEEAKHTPGNVAPVWTVDDLISVGVDNPAYYDSESGLCTKLPSTETKKPSWQSHKEMSFPTDEVHKSQCSFRAVLILTAASFLVIVLLATIATVAYIAVGEPTINWAAEDLNEDGGISVIEGQLKITNRIFTKDLLIPNSQAYLKLSAQVKQSMDAVFLQSGLAPYYNETGIVSYSPGSVILRCRIHLSKSRLDATHEVGMAVIQALERHHGFLPGGYLHVDIRSLHFIGLENKVQDSAPENYLHGLPVAAWSPWSEWTPCKHPCDIQSRFRKCRIERGNNLLEHSEPCAQLDGSDREVRNCPCPPPPSPQPAEPITIENNSSTNCEDCGEHKICLLLSQTSTAQCLVPRDANDPTGCGGWCVGQHEICKPLDNNTFQCMDNSECLPQQWQCANGLCISLEDRCDGQFGCYDMSDEFNCECKPDEFHCGNNTSCLPKGLLCNGQVDCWDASDEFNCTQLCPTSQYTCNTGRCIDKLHFCDGYPDCDDGSDEPEGCSGPCLHTQKQCHNGRCINSLLWCNAADDCGDGTDELYCSAPQMLHENNHHRPAE